jgi:hypothetical protein
MDTIRIYKTETCWAANFQNHSEGQEIIRLFGTAELPLPFTPAASEIAVRASLQQGYPGARIVTLQPVH